MSTCTILRGDGVTVRQGDVCSAPSGAGLGFTSTRTATMPSSYRITIGINSSNIEVMSGGVIAAATAAATTIA